MAANASIKTPDMIWWDTAPGPALFVRETADTLSGGKSVCLCTRNALPWREIFFQRVTDAVREIESSLLFEEADSDAEDPARYLINHFRLDAAFRPTKKPVDFLRERRVLANRVIRVTAEGDQARRWFEFIKAYKSSSVQGGLFLMETHAAPPARVSKDIRFLDYDDFVSDYDALVFAGLLTDNSLSVEQKRYVSTMAVSLLGADAESIADFAENYRFDQDDPEKCFVAHDSSELSRRVWNAQVQTLFPLIMREYRALVDDWRAPIEEAIAYVSDAFPDGLVDTNHDQIQTPDEMELATMHYLMRNRRRDAIGYDTDDYMLYIPDEQARLHLKLLYNMRNQIAHGKVCPVGDVVQLLMRSDEAL